MVKRNAQWKLGPFSIFPRFLLQNIGYDDNIYRRPEEQEPVSDFTMTLAAEAKVYYLFGHSLILSFTGVPEYVYYATEVNERKFNSTVTPAFRMKVLRGFVLSGAYTRRTRRWRPTSEFTSKENEKIEKYKGSFFIETPRETALGVIFSQARITYDPVFPPDEGVLLSSELDREEVKRGLEFYYKFFPDKYFFLKGEYLDYKFLSRESSFKDSYSYTLFTGILFPILGRSQGMFSVGYKILKPRLETRESFSGFVGQTDLQFRTGRFIIRLRQNSDCYFTYWRNSVYFVDNAYGIGFSYYLTRFIRLNYNFLYSGSRYSDEILRELPDGTIESFKRKDFNRTHSTGFTVKIIRSLGLGLTVSFWSKDSNYEVTQRYQMFVGANLTYDF